MFGFLAYWETIDRPNDIFKNVEEKNMRRAALGQEQ